MKNLIQIFHFTFPFLFSVIKPWPEYWFYIQCLSYEILFFRIKNKFSGNKITGIMVLRKKVLSLGKMRTILFHKKDFFLCICIFNIDRGVFNVKSQFFHVLKTLCSVCSFLGTFLYKIILEPVKKS